MAGKKLCSEKFDFRADAIKTIFLYERAHDCACENGSYFVKPTQIEATLSKIDGGFVQVIGDWDQLDSLIARNLISWASVSKNRAYGVQDREFYERGKTKMFSRPSDTVAEVDPSKLVVHSRSGSVATTLKKVLSLQSSSRPPFALSLTNHGAEHCIVLEDRWIVADEDVLQGALGVLTNRISSPVVLLNACGSLRLGDSSVPKKYSVAGSLAESGSNVIGPIRIIPVFPDIGSLFAKLILLGEPLGRIVNALNLHMEDVYGERGAFHLLGDPTFTICSDAAVSASTIEYNKPKINIRSVLTSVGALTACVELFETLNRCGTWETNPDENIESVFEALRTGVLAISAKQTILDSPDSVSILKEYLDSAVSHFSTTLFDLISKRIRDGRWIGSLYAQFSAERLGSWGSCARCGDEAITIQFNPFGYGETHFSRTECDRCGTTADRIGKMEVEDTIKVNVTTTALEVLLPKRNSFGIAKVLVHRGGQNSGCHWPEEGGVVVLPRSDLAVHGRVTVSALCVIGAEVTALYHTIFVPKRLS